LITRNQQFFLDFIKEHPYSDIDFLVDELEIRKNVVSRMLHTLEDKQLIEFGGDPDTYGMHNSQGGASTNHSGWIVIENIPHNGD